MRKLALIAFAAMSMVACKKEDAVAPKVPDTDSLNWTFNMSIPSMDFKLENIHPTDHRIVLSNSTPIGHDYIYQIGDTYINVLYFWSNGSVRIEGTINGRGFIDSNGVTTVNVCGLGVNIPITFRLYDHKGALRAS